MIPAKSMTSLRCLAFFSIWLTLASINADAQKVWQSPCAAPGGSKEPQKDVCDFLENTYREMDDRCGIVPVKRLWPPWNVLRHLPDYDVIPKTVLQDTPLSIGDTTSWAELTMPSLTRIMTMVDPFANPAALSETLAQSTDYPQTMQFNPLLAPDIMKDNGISNQKQIISCANALSASEDGHLTLSVAAASQKFTAQSKSSSSMNLYYGRFESPMTYLLNHYESAYYYEALDIHRRYLLAKLGEPTGLRYISLLDAIIVYNTVSGELTSDLTASASGSAGSLVGSVEASASGERTNNSSSSASLFHGLIRNVAYAPLPSLDDTTKKLSQIAANGSLISMIDPNAKGAAYDKTSGNVRVSFVLPHLPIAMCTPDLWKLTPSAPPVPKDGVLELSIKPVSPTSTGGPETGPTVSRKLCLATITTPDSDGEHITGTLDFVYDPYPKAPDLGTVNIAKFNFNYSLADPGLKLMAIPTPGSATVDFWYQINKPSAVDMTATPTLNSRSLSCGASNLSSPIGTVAYSATYAPAAGASISGTFLHVQYQYALSQFNPVLAAAPAACTPVASVGVTTPSGAPKTVSLPKTL
jgi:hypothetical protein